MVHIWSVKLNNKYTHGQGVPVFHIRCFFLFAECTIDFTSDIMFVLGSVSQNPAGAVGALGMIQDIIKDQNTFVG